MATFKVKVKNENEVEKKPRVYFTCHPEDFEKYFDKICNDIFKTHDCAIYYKEDMTERIKEEEKEADLGRNNLFVVPVTYRLLSEPNPAMDEEIPYAVKEHIPVLPVMMEPRLDAVYSKPDKFGELQYLNPFSTDLTEISYGEKLKKYLESVLISNEMAERIRKAFDAYIFLSYRKKDRKYANELMRLIHSNPECRDIAIWFDEFLTPGESFKKTIEKMLDDCKLFTLLVTPQLLEKVVDEKGEERDNYVVSTELPLAREKKKENGTDIFAVEMEETNREELSLIDIKECVNSKDEEFRNRLIEAISKIATKENNTPEHNFLIGLAYLDGIDVEVDREKGIELVTSSAEEGLLEAMERLCSIYSEGIGTNVDYKKAVYWAEKIVEYNKKCHGDEHPDTLDALHKLAYTYNICGDYRKSIELNENVYNLMCRVLGEEHPDTLSALNNMATGYIFLGKYEKALTLEKKVYKIIRRISGEKSSDALKILGNLGYIYTKLNKHNKALEIQKNAYELSCRIHGENDGETLIYLHNLGLAYGNLNEHEKALELKQKAYDMNCEISGAEHPKTLAAMNNLAHTLGSLKKYEKAIELKEKACDIGKRVLGEEHPDVLIYMNSLGITYSDNKEYFKALKIYKRVYELRTKVLGENAPDTIDSLYNIAFNTYASGDGKQAFLLLKKAYEKHCEVFGENDPETVGILKELVQIAGLTGNLPAEMIYKNKLKSLKKS